VLKGTVIDQAYKSVGSEMMTHGLFGGAKSREQNNSLYERKVYSRNGIFFCEILVLDQTVICRKLPRLKREPWTRVERIRDMVFVVFARLLQVNSTCYFAPTLNL
jgi:hypothetical protein